MAIIHRRTFYGKVGSADQLVQLMNEGNEGMARFGACLKARVFTDAMTGRSDRVVVEWEVDNIGDMDSAMARVMGDPDGAAFFQWLDAEVERTDRIRRRRILDCALGFVHQEAGRGLEDGP